MPKIEERYASLHGYRREINEGLRELAGCYPLHRLDLFVADVSELLCSAVVLGCGSDEQRRDAVGATLVAVISDVKAVLLEGAVPGLTQDSERVPHGR